MQPHTYGFRFSGEHQKRVAGLYAIGREKQVNHTYQWNGLEREEKDIIVFQYTLSGFGAIWIGDQEYQLPAGKAFLVEVPSDHCYYLPKESEEWEFLYITTFGEEMEHFYRTIKERNGNVLEIERKASPITHIERVIDKIRSVGIDNSYEASGYAYTFMMELMQYLEYGNSSLDELPIAIAKAVSFIDANYSKDLSLDDIVEVSEVSKYHFIRLFSKTMKKTPIQYVTKIRLEKAVELLHSTELSIQEIAQQTGFQSANYFSKVFKQYFSISPGKYRHSKGHMPVNRLFFN